MHRVRAHSPLVRYVVAPVHVCLQYCEKEEEKEREKQRKRESTRNMSLYRNINMYLLVLLLCVIFAGNAHAAATINNSSPGQPGGEQTSNEVGEYNDTEINNVRNDLLQLEKYAEELSTIGPILKQLIFVIKAFFKIMPERYTDQCLGFMNNTFMMSIDAIIFLEKLTIILILIEKLHYFSF